MTEPITCKLESLPMPRDMEELKAQCDEITHMLVEAEALKKENEVLRDLVKELYRIVEENGLRVAPSQADVDLLKKVAAAIATTDEPPKVIIDAQPRYPENATVNGEEEDNDNPKMPLLSNGGIEYGEQVWKWHLEIDMHTGKIAGWPEGTTAKVWYKVCDMCKVSIAGMKPYDGYVPNFLSIDGSGYGDYIYITIGPDGTIKNWSESAVKAWRKEWEKEADRD